MNIIIIFWLLIFPAKDINSGPTRFTGDHLSGRIERIGMGELKGKIIHRKTIDSGRGRRHE